MALRPLASPGPIPPAAALADDAFRTDAFGIPNRRFLLGDRAGAADAAARRSGTPSAARGARRLGGRSLSLSEISLSLSLISLSLSDLSLSLSEISL